MREAVVTRAIVIRPRSPPPDIIVDPTAASGPAASGPTPPSSNSPQDVTQQKTQKQKQSDMLSDEDEESMLELLLANTFLYNMNSKDYKDNTRSSEHRCGRHRPTRLG